MNFLDLINELGPGGELQPPDRFGMVASLVNRHVRDFPSIPELPDLSGVQGFVTGPVWRNAKGSDLIAHLVFEAVVARIRSVDELRVLADRGYFSRDDYRQAWALLAEQGAVHQTDLVAEDSLRFGWSDSLFASFLQTGCVVSDWTIR